MENNYQYLDPDYKYTKKNGVLHNLADIEDEKILLVYESLKATTIKKFGISEFQQKATSFCN